MYKMTKPEENIIVKTCACIWVRKCCLSNEVSVSTCTGQLFFFANYYHSMHSKNGERESQRSFRRC